MTRNLRRLAQARSHGSVNGCSDSSKSLSRGDNKTGALAIVWRRTRHASNRCCRASRADVGHVPRDERFANGQPGVRQGALKEMPQHAGQASVNAVLAEHVLLAPQRHAHQGALANESTSIVEALAAVDDAGHQHPVDPAFENGRGGEPEDRKVEHEKIAPAQLLQLKLDIWRNGPSRHALSLLEGIDTIVGIRTRSETAAEVTGLKRMA